MSKPRISRAAMDVLRDFQQKHTHYVAAGPDPQPAQDEFEQIESDMADELGDALDTLDVEADDDGDK